MKEDNLVMSNETPEGPKYSNKPLSKSIYDVVWPHINIGLTK